MIILSHNLEFANRQYILLLCPSSHSLCCRPLVKYSVTVTTHQSYKLLSTSAPMLEIRSFLFIYYLAGCRFPYRRIFFSSRVLPSFWSNTPVQYRVISLSIFFRSTVQYSTVLLSNVPPSSDILTSSCPQWWAK
jgi:hypothetical protein